MYPSYIGDGSNSGMSIKLPAIFFRYQDFHPIRFSTAHGQVPVLRGPCEPAFECSSRGGAVAPLESGDEPWVFVGVISQSFWNQIHVYTRSILIYVIIYIYLHVCQCVYWYVYFLSILNFAFQECETDKMWESRERLLSWISDIRTCSSCKILVNLCRAAAISCSVSQGPRKNSSQLFLAFQDGTLAVPFGNLT